LGTTSISVSALKPTHGRNRRKHWTKIAIPQKHREWLDAMDSVEAFEGIGRVDELLDGIVQAARRKGAKLSFATNTAYVNTISPDNEPKHPGDRAIEHKIRSLIRCAAASRSTATMDSTSSSKAFMMRSAIGPRFASTV
jgi:pyruvate dehydrogenase complex dehydrogenase (E1) component